MRYHIPGARYQSSMVREELQRVARKRQRGTHKKYHDERLSSSAAAHKRAHERGGGIAGAAPAGRG